MDSSNLNLNDSLITIQEGFNETFLRFKGWCGVSIHFLTECKNICNSRNYSQFGWRSYK